MTASEQDKPAMRRELEEIRQNYATLKNSHECLRADVWELREMIGMSLEMREERGE